ncbi:uncharacterized protein LOC124886664 [Capsicum annuum]|uniref:uncharacterized protein LOC124886664 n=1 Tax=Capsicum annuum TaxID=4072 RepID=UPI001FB0FFA1|nr:uncharacterized protein LOC124886664 [Capsicum annuum]
MYFAPSNDVVKVVMRDEIFIVKKLSRFAPHICSYSDKDIYGSIRAILNKEQFKNFCDNNIFGYFMKKQQCVVQAQLCRCVMTLEVKGNSFFGILICANGTFLNFTPRKFAIITGLNCVSNSGRYKDFLWGSLSFEDLVRSLNNRLKTDGQFYLIQGMPLAIQTIAPRPRFEFLMNAMFSDNDKVVFKNVEPTKKELSKLQIPQKNAIRHERSVDSDDDLQDPPPRKINEHSKKKQKVYPSTPMANKPLRKKQVNIFDEHTQTRTPAPRAAKADGMKTPVFKPIPTRQASSSKTKKEKQTVRVIFPQVQSKPDIHVEEVAVSKPESHVEKEAFISKKDCDAFRDEVRSEFKEIRGLMRKKFKKMKKAFAQSKERVVDIEADKPNVDEGGLEQSGQHFSPDVVQSSDNISDVTKQQRTDKDPDLQNMDYVGTERSPQRLTSEVGQELEVNLLDKKTSDEKIHKIILSDLQFTIPDEMLPNLNSYQIQRIIIHLSANRQEESHHEILDTKTSETVIKDHAQMNRRITDLTSNSLVNSEVELATKEQVRKPPNTQEVTNYEQRDEKLWPDSQNTIPDEFLPSLDVYDQKSIMIHPSANREVKTPRPKLRIRRPSKFKESPYTKKFGSANGSSAGLIRIFLQKHPFLYHPIDGIIDTKIVKNFKD